MAVPGEVFYFCRSSFAMAVKGGIWLASNLRSQVFLQLPSYESNPYHLLHMMSAVDAGIIFQVKPSITSGFIVWVVVVETLSEPCGLKSEMIGPSRGSHLTSWPLGSCLVLCFLTLLSRYFVHVLFLDSRSLGLQEPAFGLRRAAKTNLSHGFESWSADFEI